MNLIGEIGLRVPSGFRVEWSNGKLFEHDEISGSPEAKCSLRY